MPTLEEVLRHPRFAGLPDEEKIRALEMSDARFKALPPTEKYKFVKMPFAATTPPAIKDPNTPGLLSTPIRAIEGVKRTLVDPMIQAGSEIAGAVAEDPMRAVVGSPQHIMSTGRGLRNMFHGAQASSEEQFTKGFEQMDQGGAGGRGPDNAGLSATGRFIAGSVPLIGPAAGEEVDRITKGDVAGGAGGILGMILPLVMANKFRRGPAAAPSGGAGVPPPAPPVTAAGPTPVAPAPVAAPAVARPISAGQQQIAETFKAKAGVSRRDFLKTSTGATVGMTAGGPAGAVKAIAKAPGWAEAAAFLTAAKPVFSLARSLAEKANDVASLLSNQQRRELVNSINKRLSRETVKAGISSVGESYANNPHVSTGHYGEINSNRGNKAASIGSGIRATHSRSDLSALGPDIEALSKTAENNLTPILNDFEKAGHMTLPHHAKIDAGMFVNAYENISSSLKELKKYPAAQAVVPKLQVVVDRMQDIFIRGHKTSVWLDPGTRKGVFKILLEEIQKIPYSEGRDHAADILYRLSAIDRTVIDPSLVRQAYSLRGQILPSGLDPINYIMKKGGKAVGKIAGKVTKTATESTKNLKQEFEAFLEELESDAPAPTPIQAQTQPAPQAAAKRQVLSPEQPTPPQVAHPTVAAPPEAPTLKSPSAEVQVPKKGAATSEYVPTPESKAIADKANLRIAEGNLEKAKASGAAPDVIDDLESKVAFYGGQIAAPKALAPIKAPAAPTPPAVPAKSSSFNYEYLPIRGDGTRTRINLDTKAREVYKEINGKPTWVKEAEAAPTTPKISLQGTPKEQIRIRGVLETAKGEGINAKDLLERFIHAANVARVGGKLAITGHVTPMAAMSGARSMARLASKPWGANILKKWIKAMPGSAQAQFWLARMGDALRKEEEREKRGSRPPTSP